MSTLDQDLDAMARPITTHGLELTDARQARVGDMTVRRLLPLRLRRSVGAWCFVDHYGPMSVDGVTGMAVPPHPPIGLQTVTWLLAGNVLNRDSLGSEQMIKLPTGHDGIPVAAPNGSTMLLLGGVPLGERLLMWWNFVARTPQEIQAAVIDWEAGRFGEVGGYAGDPLKAPPLRPDLLTRKP